MNFKTQPTAAAEASRRLKGCCMSLLLGATALASGTASAAEQVYPPVDGAWILLGQGTVRPSFVASMGHCMDLLLNNASVNDCSWGWATDIYESAEEPGWYRLNPFTDPEMVKDIYKNFENVAQPGEAPEILFDDWIYINAQDGDKVWMAERPINITTIGLGYYRKNFGDDETLTRYDITSPVIFGSLCDENGWSAKWDAHKGYGHKKGDKIEFGQDGWGDNNSTGLIAYRDETTNYYQGHCMWDNSDTTDPRDSSSKNYDYYSSHKVAVSNAKQLLLNPTYSFTIQLPPKMSVGTGMSPEETTEAEYFDLTGRKVTAPGAGLYIRRQGTKAEKVLLR